MKNTFAGCIFSLSVLIGITSCSQPAAKKQVTADTLARPVTAVMLQTRATTLRQLTLGHYCGQCSHNCATMYRCKLEKNAVPMLDMDNTDSFLKGESITFNLMLPDPIKYRAVEALAARLPDSLRYYAAGAKRFGCPDCRDQCGIYLEVTSNITTTKFYIDRDTSQLPVYLRRFAAELDQLIIQLNR